MQLEHTFTVPAGIEQAWQVLLDIERVAPCMPGAALDSVDGDDFTGTVKVRLGPIGLTYKGKASFVEKNEADRRAVIDAHGRDARGNGTANAKVTATLAAEGESSTRVTVLTDLNITGKPAQFGRGVMVDVGNKLIGQFADCLAGQLAGPAGAAAEAPASAQPTVGETPVVEAESAPAEAQIETAAAVAGVPGSAEAEAVREAPAIAEPTAAAAEIAAGERPTGVETGEQPASERPASDLAAGDEATADSTAPGTGRTDTTTPGPRRITPPREVEPIDLLGSAGMAVAKRLVPFVAALAVLIALAIIRRRRR